MPTESEILRARMTGETPQRQYEPNVGGVPLDAFMAQERVLRENGYSALIGDEGDTVGGQKPYTGELYTPQGEANTSHVPLYAPQSKPVSSNWAWNKSHLEGLVSGEMTNVQNNADALLVDQTIESFVVTELRERYATEDLIDFGRLEGLQDMDPEERNQRIVAEAMRYDAAKENTTMLLAIHMLSQGYGSMPQRALEETWMDMTPSMLQGLREQYRQGQMQDLQREIDAIAAQEGEDGGVHVGQVVMQDLAPFWGAITRVAINHKFVPEDLEIRSIDNVLPGEIRQEIREWWVDASHEERLDYIRDIRREFEELRKGEMSKVFTNYGVVEAMMGLFTDEVLQNNVPQDTLDRWTGNLDTLVGGVIAAGTIFKRGTSVLGLWSSRRAVDAHNAAAAAGNREALDAIDSSIASAAQRYELRPGEVAVPDLPRPGHLQEGIEVAPDSVKQVVARAEPRRQRVLDNLNDVTGLGLVRADKDRVQAEVIDELTRGDTIHANHRMTAVETLQDDTGIRVTVTYGQSPGSGWSDFGDLVDDLLDLDKNLEMFRIMRRNSTGHLEHVDVTADEIARFVTKGEVPVILEQALDPFSASTRLFGGIKLSKVPSRRLIEVLRTLDPNSQDALNILEVLRLRKAGRDAPDALLMQNGEELFLQRTVDRFWQTTDKKSLSGSWAESWAQRLLPTSLFTRLFPPNARFSKDLFESFNTAYLKEQATRGDFSEMVKPYHELSRSDKEAVGHIFEWAEDFAKDMHEATGVARPPIWSELIRQFPDATDAQLAGFAAVRSAMDLQYEIFNRRLFRNWASLGYRTARSVDGSAPNYHGKTLEVDNAPREGTFYDPYNNEAVHLDADAVADLYANDGMLLQLDMAIDGPAGTGRFDTVIVRRGDYEIGDLSRTPLNYYAGYTMRFYEDPYFIVKRTRQTSLNGRHLKGSEEITEAIRTAGTHTEGMRFLRRLGRQTDKLGRIIDPKDPNVTYEIVRSKNINNTEGTLYQQQALYREGRLFWDTRQHERLPDVNGNRAKINDIGQTLEKGTALALRQATHEDLFKTIKNALATEFEDIIKPADIASDDVGEILKDLTDAARTADTPQARRRIGDAISLVRYLRSQLGTDSFLVPTIRELELRIAQQINRIPGLNRLTKGLEAHAMSVDPFRFLRSVGYHTFMVFRPFRQALLQSGQISYLTALDPTYISSGKIFIDSLALRRGYGLSRRAGFDDGWSDSKMAKMMGLSKKEYRRLVQEFDRSGLLDTVNVHAFNPGAGMASRARLGDTPVGRFAYHVRTNFSRFRDGFAKYGFEWGERNNLTFTYMLALRRHMKRNNYSSLTEIPRKEWDELATEASNLALAMTRPNKFSYQSGAAGTAFQFLSFSHKALLGMLGQNPALKGQGWKIGIMGYALFGSNLFGAEDQAREWLSSLGIGNKVNDEILPGVTLQDLLAAGIVESSFNAIMAATFDSWKDLDLGPLAPGANIVDIYKQWYTAIVEGFGPEDLLGPSSTPVNGFMKGWRFMSYDWDNDHRSPQEKFLGAADLFTREIFPQVNDVSRAWYAYQMGQWLDKDGDTLPVQPTINGMIARGFFGIRPDDELAIYRMRYLYWRDQENIKAHQENLKTYLKQLARGWEAGEWDDEEIMRMAQAAFALYEDAPEGIRREVYQGALLDGDFNNPSVVETIAEMVNQGGTNIEAIIPWIDLQGDMTPQEKQALTELVRDVQRGYRESDELYRKLLEQESGLE